MKGQIWYVAFLIGVMCLIRLSMAIAGYSAPYWLMEQLHIPIAVNVQMPYVIRVWAIRDIVLAVLVVLSNKNYIKSLLLACIAIDATDVLSAHLGGLAGLFNEGETLSLKLTAIAALIPEVIVLVLLLLPSNKQSSPDYQS